MSGLGSGAGGAWAGRIFALGWRPESFLVVARVLRETLDLVVDARTTPSSGGDTSHPGFDWKGIGWEAAYGTQFEMLETVLKSFDPSLSGILAVDTVSFPTSPTADSEFGRWLRDTMEKIERIVRKVDRLADSETGMVPEEALKGGELRAYVETAKADTKRLTTEIRAGVDNVLALILAGQPMHDLLQAAKLEDDALTTALQINPRLIHVEGIASRVRRAVEVRDHRFLRRLERALKSGPAIQKNARIGFILAVLWDAGLKRLRYPQIRGFLKAAGFHNVPAPQALERYAQRMGLKKYWMD